MKRLALFAWCLLVPVPYSVAAGVVRVADGDCAGLSAAANAAPGNEPSLIVLARNGDYNCQISVAGTVAIEGSGSRWEMQPPRGDTCRVPGSQIRIDGKLTLRNLNFVPAATASASSKSTQSSVSQPQFCYPFSGPEIDNFGTLVVESSSIRDPDQIYNYGNLALSNVTLTNASPHGTRPVVFFSPNLPSVPATITITNSTLDVGGATSLIAETLPNGWVGTISIANSIVVGGSASLCDFGSAANSSGTSFGGNLLKDKSCGFNAASDRIANDAGLTDVGRHGGIVDTIALSYYSPARDLGIAANCEATDARGVARGSNHCSAGAYEFGGGEGSLSASGASGLYFDPAHNGHYVTAQRLDWGDALVIWNTFDETGAPAWLYGVGTVSGNTIHVAQVSQNLGGKLQPGGAVTGSTETIWGSFDFTVGDCLSASLAYHSTQPKFGSGAVSLTRLAMVKGLDCSP